MWTFRRPCMDRPVPRPFLHNAWLDVTTKNQKDERRSAGARARADAALDPRGAARFLRGWSAAEKRKRRSTVCVGLDPQRFYGPVHDSGGRSAATSLLVWGAAPEMACGWGVTSPCRVA